MRVAGRQPEEGHDRPDEGERERGGYRACQRSLTTGEADPAEYHDANTVQRVQLAGGGVADAGSRGESETGQGCQHAAGGVGSKPEPGDGQACEQGRRAIAAHGIQAVPEPLDNEVNVMALGELRAGLAAGVRHALYVKLGTGIGAGLISNGKLHRGAQGCAGDLGHISAVDDKSALCRCGNYGCLEALAGGGALGRDGERAAREGRSPYLASVLGAGGIVTAQDVATGAQSGDRASHDLLVRAGALIGETLASLVSFFNPSLILVGGGVADAGDLLMAAIREATYRRALPLATRDLRLTRSALGKHSGLTGAAYMVSDELFSRALLPVWLGRGSPIGLAGQIQPAQLQLSARRSD